MDLIIRGANLPDGRTGIDIGITGERIAAVEKHLQVKATREIDARGRLVCPPFVDPHFHMSVDVGVPSPLSRLRVGYPPPNIFRRLLKPAS